VERLEADVIIIGAGPAGLVVAQRLLEARISSLVLDGCYARLARAPDYPWGVPHEELEQNIADLEGHELGQLVGMQLA